MKYFKIERTMTPHPARGLRGNVHGLLDLTALHINPMKRGGGTWLPEGGCFWYLRHLQYIYFGTLNIYTVLG